MELASQQGRAGKADGGLDGVRGEGFRSCWCDWLGVLGVIWLGSDWFWWSGLDLLGSDSVGAALSEGGDAWCGCALAGCSYRTISID